MLSLFAEFVMPDAAYNATAAAMTALCSTTHLVGVCKTPYNASLFNSNCFPMTAVSILDPVHTAL